ncbi:hypothetical protein PIB30_035865 [Stylosanthes scabra]|uniref:Uncharacterized protein n=1 Tax=Stylosanthes scabra TaxID=79078 RepID=A0ABU6SET9_9FABA|nr:hypothetical protein [Stylosanthes scabra]
MEECPIKEIAAVDRRKMYRLNEVSHVAHNVRTPFSAGMHSRFQQLFEVVQSADPGPTADFIQWILAARRYLVPADRFHQLPSDEIPIEATQRQSGPHVARPDVPHVPDNRRPARRMMVGTRTTARDWQ